MTGTKGVPRVFAHEQDASDAAEVLGQMMDDAGLTAIEKEFARNRLSEKIKTILAANGTIKKDKLYKETKYGY